MNTRTTKHTKEGSGRFPVNFAAILVMAVVAIVGVAVLETATRAGDIANLTSLGGRINCVNLAKTANDPLSECLSCCQSLGGTEAARCESQCVKNYDSGSQFPGDGGGGGGKSACHKDSDCGAGEICASLGKGVRVCQAP